MPRFIDTDPTPDEYLYNKVLVKLTPEQAAIPASQLTVRVAASNGTEDTFKVTEWVGTGLPPHVAGYQQGFFTRYQDPTENRAQLDKLAADFPNLVTPVNLPNLTNGYQRKSSAILYGTNAIGIAPTATIGAPIFNSEGEITAAAPVARIPFTATAGQQLRATVDAKPSGETDFILTLTNAAGPNAGQHDRHGHQPGVPDDHVRDGRRRTSYEISGYQGDLGDFTFELQPGDRHARRRPRTARSCSPSKDWGHLGGDQVTAEFKTGRRRLAAVRRRDRQGHRRQPGHGRHRRVHQHGRAGRRRDQRRPRGLGAGDGHDVPRQRGRRHRHPARRRSTWTTS